MYTAMKETAEELTVYCVTDNVLLKQNGLKRKFTAKTLSWNTWG